MAGDFFEIHFSESPPNEPPSVGYADLYGTITPVEGATNTYQITGLDFDRSAGFGDPVTGLDSTSDNQIYVSSGLSGSSENAVTHVLDTSGVSFHTGGTSSDPTVYHYNIFADSKSGTGYSLSYGGSSTVPIYVRTVSAFCFVSGTLLQTATGWVAVETLRAGDMMVTASGETRPIRWLGHRSVQCGGADGQDSWPVRVRAGAFAQGIPSSDLWLSPGHSVCVDVVGEVLIPIGKLVNGATIAQVETDEVMYWHVELESHDILLAEGLPVESYLDTDGRSWFAARKAKPEPLSGSGHCRPFRDSGQLVEAVRERLAERARLLGWSDGGYPNIHMIVDGVRVDPELLGGAARFLLPAAAREAWLCSEAFMPAVWNAQGDNRLLGLLVSDIELQRVDGTIEIVPISDPRFDTGFHAPEHHDGQVWRWTNGMGRLPFSGAPDPLLLTVRFHPTATSCWQAPRAGVVKAKHLCLA